MKSGLYALRRPLRRDRRAPRAMGRNGSTRPMTKESKVYFRVEEGAARSRGDSAWRRGIRAIAGPGHCRAHRRGSSSRMAGLLGGGRPRATRSSTGPFLAGPRPGIAAPISPRKGALPIQSRVKSLGTARMNRSPSSSRPWVSPEPGSVGRVVEALPPEADRQTSPHRLSAVSSIWCSTPAGRPP